ncbi:sigma-54-dependent transcriptional regulator [Pseudobdellovibrio exovorus]|uniref:Transcriptional regulatory protein zraR n=1 Tax=Pseudobdellovibrio exovorus JSS TaxID=1184267 RepID=M4VCW6_9BACT|nr:sigma-54 dependent transcriptional regulator [Pseudobdellovibrio exovorus]AGH96330.1 transcriptional regulatory protein zraR [Pseudobdellovibrio exovorus JSS]
MLKVLVVDDDQALRFSVRSALEATKKFYIEEAFDGVNAIEKIKERTAEKNKTQQAGARAFDIVILDVDMPRKNGLNTLKEIKEMDPGIIVLMLTAHATVEVAVQAVKDGAYNFLSKPLSSDELIQLIDKAVTAHTLISTLAVSSPVFVDEGRKIIGNTSQMQKVFNVIHKLAKVDTPVLIRGASGTGKELVAKAIHFNSARKDEKFVAINCSAIPENLFESELFGHEKGSFTGASERKIGKFQFAEGGTLFLDEVGDMPQLMQVKILRVLQEKLFMPVGSNREIPTNVRIIAATNRPLEEMMKDGRFREDLFYRLNVVPIFLPQLADRKDDLEVLIHIFIRKFNQIHGKRLTGISAEALSVLKRYGWPGNIRELENVIEHSFVLESSNTISLGSLPEALLEAAGVSLVETMQNLESQSETLKKSAQVFSSTEIDSENDFDIDSEIDDDSLESCADEDISISISDSASLDFNAQKEEFEKQFIIKALKTFKGRINQTALHANIPKKTLLRKIEKYGIVAKEYAEPKS